jgi:hypothetical protein
MQRKDFQNGKSYEKKRTDVSDPKSLNCWAAAVVWSIQLCQVGLEERMKKEA